MASEISTGMMKIMKKMDEAVNTGNYYEALQMYRSLNSRYTAQNNFSGLIEILYKGAQKVLTKNEEEIGLDLLDLLLTALTAELAHLKAIAKDKKRNFEDYKDPFVRDWIIKLKELLRLVHGGHPIREELISKIVRWSGEGHDPGHPSVHKAIAQLYKSEKNYACAFQHFFKASNGSDLASFLIEYQQNLGYKYEEDLFIANIVLNYLSNKNIEFASITFNKYTNDHPKIREKEPPFLLPLLNFLWFLIKTLERPEPAVKQFVVLCDVYEPSINRDPSYQDYLDKIALLYYGIKKPKPLNTGGGGIGELLMNAYREISINEPESVSSAALRHVRDNADVD